MDAVDSLNENKNKKKQLVTKDDPCATVSTSVMKM